MTGMRSLPSFSYDWIGGDMTGLQALDAACQRVAAEIGDADQALSRQVSSVAGAGGWTGKAADAFTAAWDSDSAAGKQLAGCWDKIASIVGILAEELASIENALEGAAYQLEKQGIPVDTTTGLPMTDVTAGKNACVSQQETAARGKAVTEYMTQRNLFLAAAEAARRKVVGPLETVTEAMLPPSTDWGQLANDLDGLRGIWATPTEYRKLLQEKLGPLKNTRDNVEDTMLQRLIAERKVNGNNARLPRDMVKEGASARAAVSEQEARIASAPESTLTKTAAGDADGLGLIGAAAKGLKAVPYVGLAASTGITIYQDLEDHQSVAHAVIDGVGSNGAGFAAGVAATGLVAAGVTLVGGAPVVAVAAGAVAGVAVSIGVSDFAHNIAQENWTQDWNQRGFIDGSGHGIADSFDKTRHDMAHYIDDLNPFS